MQHLTTRRHEIVQATPVREANLRRPHNKLLSDLSENNSCQVLYSCILDKWPIVPCVLVFPQTRYILLLACPVLHIILGVLKQYLDDIHDILIISMPTFPDIFTYFSVTSQN
jgi:hypothetical protein